MEERKNRIAQTPGKGKGRAGLPLGVKSTPSKTPMRTTRSERLMKDSPLKRPREEAKDDTEMDDKVLPTPKRVRVDSSTRSEFSVIEESDIAATRPSSVAEVESIVQSPLFGISRSNASTIADLADEATEAMEVDWPIFPLKRKALGQQERSRHRSKPEPEPARNEVEVLEAVEEMDWPALAAYRRRLIEARSKGRDMTELSRARWRPVFPDRTFLGGGCVRF
jgi:hypothetical protein